MKIGVVGGGIIGVTSALVLAEAGHDVCVMSKEDIRKSTSWAAGAICYPFGCEESERILDWTLYTHEVLGGLLDLPKAGVYRADWQKLSVDEACEYPFWLDRFEDGRVLSAAECPAPYRSGIGAQLLIMGVDEYVPYLMTRFQNAGGRYEIENVETFEGVSERYDLLINTTGIDARDFVGDETVYPARGQVLIVNNPGVKKHTALFDRKYYIYPRGEQCLLGGSFDENEWDRTPDAQLTQEILDWAVGFEPLLAGSEVLDVRVGLRPMRPKVRLEKGRLESGTPVIHNYGHGGAGYTLSWGCAREVLKLLETL